MPTFTELRQEFAATHKAASDLIELCATEDRELKPEEKTENEKRFTRLEQIKKTLDEQAKFAALAVTGEPGKGKVEATQDAPGREEFEQAQARDQFSAKAGESAAGAMQRHRDAVNFFIRSGNNPGKQFTLTTGTGSGVLLPTVIGPPVVIKAIRNPVRAALLARGLKVITTDSMDSMSVPVFDDSANVAYAIAQDSTSENNLDPTVTGLTLGADLYDSGTVWASNTLLGSLNFDLLAYLEPMLDARIAAKELALWMADLVANATVGKTTATTTGVTYAELLDWQHSIPVARRADGVFFLSDGLQRAIRGLVDSTGQPIYQLSLRDSAPDTLLGWPVFVTTGLATPAAGAVSGIAASAEALVIRDVNNRRIARYSNVPTHPDQFGIRMFANGDFAFVTGGVRALKHAAS